MIIKKLILSAFGPYASKQELDFEKNLENKNMFVITGNTGAGKTTIFDAINFVLYGEASGSERDGKSLRSDFADSSTKTEVELWFSLRNKDYYIKRSPQYFRPKQKGEGLTESKAEAELKFDETIVTGSKEVTRRVEEILGITSEQFKQLVMIPQGEFKKLLNSDSDKKEEIFRKIFGTKVFSDIQQNIKLKASTLKKSVEEVERDIANKIKSFVVKDDNEFLKDIISNKELNIELILEEFKKAIELDKEEEKVLKEKFDKIETRFNDLSKGLVLGKETNKKIEVLNRNKQVLEQLVSLSEVFKLKDEELKYAKKAVTALTYEDKYNEKKKSLDRIKGNLNLSLKNLEEIKVNLEDAKIKLKEEVKKEAVRLEISKKLDEIRLLKEKTLTYQESSEKLNLLKANYEKIKERILVVKKEIETNSNTIIKINEQIILINNLREELSNLNIEVLNLKGKEEKLTSLNLAFNKLCDELLKEKKLKNEYTNLNDIYINKRKRYENLDESFRKNLAGILAKDLKDGEECPVCGSKNHIKVAILEDENINEEQVKKAKMEEEKSRADMEASLNKLTETKAEINSLKNERINELYKEIFNEELKEELQLNIDKSNEFFILIKENLKKALDRKNQIEKELLKEVNLNNKKIELESLNDSLRTELDKSNSEILSKEGEVKTQEANLNNILNDFKGNIRSVKELDLEENNLNNKLKILKENYEKAESKFKEVQTIFDKENGNKETLENMQKESDIELKLALQEFKEKVLSLGFKDYKDYVSKRKAEAEIDKLEDDIKKYTMNLSNAKQAYEVSLEECKNLNVIDIKEIELKIEEVNKEKTSINNFIKEVYLRVNQNIKILNDCLELNKKIKVDEEQYKTIGKLSKIINGDNPRKISFERYVLAAYFEDIISAANIRFSKMTNNRFELLRKENIGDKRKGQGLDLEVFDSYTGKSRDVKTLSGGESFKASLAMALGLADVVQRYSGGIQLDTIFIDEGFGTLDPESLDIAIECLIGLQDDGRVVGVISHVQELKDRIEVKLEVSSTNKGSEARFKV